MRMSQVEWASRHNWFLSYFKIGPEYIVLVKTNVMSDLGLKKAKSFSSYIELKSWVGENHGLR